jgi:hypothetical protein
LRRDAQLPPENFSIERNPARKRYLPSPSEVTLKYSTTIAYPFPTRGQEIVIESESRPVTIYIRH